jgi:hypothetical protein
MGTTCHTHGLDLCGTHGIRVLSTVLRMPRCAPPAVRWNGARYPELSVHLLLWTYEASVAEEEDSVDFEGIYTYSCPSSLSSSFKQPHSFLVPPFIHLQHCLLNPTKTYITLLHIFVDLYLPL